MENNEILKELILKKEDKVAKLKEMINKAKVLFQIDEETKKILISSEINITSKDKIILLLIGKYFQKELGLISKNSATISEISEDLVIPQTSLSAPLLELRKNKVIIKEGLEYSIPYQEIERNINRIYISIEQNNKQEQKSKKRARRGKKKEVSPKRLLDGAVDEVIKELDISDDEIKTIYSIKPEDFILLKTINYENVKEMHRDYALLIAFAYRRFYGVDQVDSTELRNKIKDTGCPSLTNLSTSLKGFPNLIIHERGKKGSIYTTYRITQQGIEFAKELIKKFSDELSNHTH